MFAKVFRFLAVISVVFYATATSADDVVHFIDVHVHYVPLGSEFSKKSKLARKKGWDGMPVAEFLSGMDSHGIDKIIIEMPPTAIWKGGNQDDFGIPKMAELYPGRVFALYGGKALTMLYRAVEKGKSGPKHKRKFIKRIERAMKTGMYKGFGEIGLHHQQTVKRANLTIKADHPWMLVLSDIAAKYDVPIDIHMDGTDQTIPALERLLAHNRKTRIIWAHAGWSELGGETTDVWERLLLRHPNLFGSIKHRKIGAQYSSRKIGIRDLWGNIEADWLRLFKKFPDRFMIGSDVKLGVRVDIGNQFHHIDRMQEFLKELPPDLRAPIARDNAIRVFNLRTGGNK